MSDPLHAALSAVLDDASAVQQPTTSQQPIPAAVLVLLGDPGAVGTDPTAWPALEVVLTKRRAELRSHAGEISCPGGRWEPSDGSLYETAVREAEEEIGLPRATVSAVGALPVVLTFVTNYAVFPFVALASGTPPADRAEGAEGANGGVDGDGRSARPRWQVSANEVEEVIELPLQRLRENRLPTHLERRGYSFETDTFTVDGHVIWGATYRILDQLIGRLERLG
jgi:8-oxo-dGTP pyrophosphatase MutT (NUDIX family)